GFTSAIHNPVILNAGVNNSGNYQLTVSAVGCPNATGTVTVVVKPIPNAQASANTPLCAGQNLQLTGANTLAGTSFSWSGPAGYSSAQQSPLINAIPVNQQGSYILTALLNGCTHKDTVEVVVNPIPNAAFTSNLPVCTGQTLQFTNTNTLAGSTYTWTGPSGFAANQQNPSKTNVQLIDAGWYKLTVVANGCSKTDSLQVSILPTPTVSFATISPVCQYQPTINLTASGNPSGGTGVFSGNGVTASQFTPSVVSPGNQLIRYTYTATNGCSNFAEQTILVHPAPVVNAGPDKNIMTGSSVQLVASSSSLPNVISWLPTTGLLQPNQLQTVAAPTVTTLYTISVTDVNGCIGKDSVRVNVLSEVFVPSAFSPNGDGINDRWNIFGLDALPNCEVSIFNRYGQLIYQSRGYTQPWDGKYKNERQPIGAYAYLIYLNDGFRKTPLKGMVMLIR
ncbi:MAG: hypothetical protein RLY16_2127, partial [Bacteroidota bacterium]